MADGDGCVLGVVSAEGRRPAKAVYVRYTAEVARAVLKRVAAGTPLSVICREVDMPSQATVARWAKRSTTFRRLLSRSKALGGWSPGGHEPAGYCPVTAAAIAARVSEGEPVTSICQDPAMPGHSTVYRWRTQEPEFAEALERARQVVAERFCDLGWEIACAVTPADAYATHVKLTQLRWTAAAMAPSRFGRFKAVAAEAEALARIAAAEAAEEAKGPRTIQLTVRRFRVETREDGAQRMVGYTRDPQTDRYERDPNDNPWGEPRPDLAGAPVTAPDHLYLKSN